jgi:murein L,D-transpeptidase YcbB/YkuD
MKSKRDSCTGPAPVHVFLKIAGAAAGMILAAAPIAISSPAAAAEPARKIAQVQATQTVADFYRNRRDAPLWLAPAAGDAAQQLIVTLSNARADGLDPGRYQVSALHEALRKAWGGDRKAVLRADQLLSEAFVAYVRDLKRDPDIGILYVDPSLKPVAPTALAALLEASAAPSLSAYVRSSGWMSPIYGQLRRALLAHEYASERERQLLTVNLERARTLPAGKGRYVIVNAAQQRLFMYEDGRAVDSMRVVVGKPKYPTPMMSALIRFASLNPYWFVPPDLAAERIAPNVLKRGLKYLDELGYQVLAKWSDNAEVIDPSTIDWQAVSRVLHHVPAVTPERLDQQIGPVGR